MKDFLKYYQEELLFLRKKGGAFAKQYPQIAELIDLKNAQSTDPHTERIIESVAFMSAKLHQKIDDNSQNIAFHLLNSISPNLTHSFPPCSVVNFCAKNEENLSDYVCIPKNTNLSTMSKNGVLCYFRTIYPINIYPLLIKKIYISRENENLGGADFWCMKIKLSTNSVPIEQMNIDSILFHINSTIIENALTIYESLFCREHTNVSLKIGNRIIRLPENSIKSVGFSDEESVLPLEKYHANIFHLFQELLHFKQKFMFFSITGISELITKHNLSNISEIELIIDIESKTDKLTQVINDDCLILNCVPVVNLFPVTTDPFRFTATQAKYLLLADQLKDKELEIHDILSVHIINSDDMEDKIVQPYFSLQTDSDTNIIHNLFWISERESSEIRNLQGFDVYLSFIDIDLNPYSSYSDVVYAKTLCTNRFETRDIPVFSYLDIDNIETGECRAKMLYKTTNTIEFSSGSNKLWNLVSQLASCNISLSDTHTLFQNIRKLFDIFDAGFSVRKNELLDGISHIEMNNIVRRFGKDAWRGFVSGLDVKIFLENTEKSFYQFILGCVINQYLSSIVSFNNFIELSLINDKTNQVIAKWKPTSGRKNLI